MNPIANNRGGAASPDPTGQGGFSPGNPELAGTAAAGGFPRRLPSRQTAGVRGESFPPAGSGAEPRLLAILTLLALLVLAGQAQAGEFDALATRLAADGQDRSQMQALFADPRVRFNPEAMGKKLMDKFTAKYGSETVRRLQDGLSQLDYYFGPATGRPDYQLRAGIRAFQTDSGLPANGRPSRAVLETVLAQRRKASPEVSAKLKALAAAGPPQMYEAILQPERLAEAKEFFDANQALLKQVEQRYGVPPTVTVGLLTVETRAGRFLGDDLALTNLASMAVSTSCAKVASVFAGESVTPDRQAYLDKLAAKWSAWAYDELRALLAYARKNGLDVLAMPGSIHGAIGVSQFMPSSLLRYGVDGDGDGKVDIFGVADAVHSMGNYLQNHGLTGNLQDEAALRQALFRYNHSEVYVNTILAVAHFLRGGPALP